MRTQAKRTKGRWWISRRGTRAHAGDKAADDGDDDAGAAEETVDEKAGEGDDDAAVVLTTAMVTVTEGIAQGPSSAKGSSWRALGKSFA